MRLKNSVLPLDSPELEAGTGVESQHIMNTYHLGWRFTQSPYSYTPNMFLCMYVYISIHIHIHIYVYTCIHEYLHTSLPPSLPIYFWEVLQRPREKRRLGQGLLPNDVVLVLVYVDQEVRERKRRPGSHCICSSRCMI